MMRAGRPWRIAPSTDIALQKAGEEEGAAAVGGSFFSARAGLSRVDLL